MGKIRKIKRNLILLKIMSLIIDAEYQDHILVISNVPNFVRKFFRRKGLSDYYREEWDYINSNYGQILHKEIYVMGSNRYVTKALFRLLPSPELNNSFRPIIRKNFEDIKWEVNELIKNSI